MGGPPRSAADRVIDVLAVDLLQGYLAHKKPHPPRTLQWNYSYGPLVALERGVVSYERGAPVADIHAADLGRHACSGT